MMEDLEIFQFDDSPVEHATLPQYVPSMGRGCRTRPNPKDIKLPRNYSTHLRRKNESRWRHPDRHEHVSSGSDPIQDYSALPQPQDPTPMDGDFLGATSRGLTAEILEGKACLMERFLGRQVPTADPSATPDPSVTPDPLASLDPGHHRRAMPGSLRSLPAYSDRLTKGSKGMSLVDVMKILSTTPTWDRSSSQGSSGTRGGRGRGREQGRGGTGSQKGRQSQAEEGEEKGGVCEGDRGGRVGRGSAVPPETAANPPQWALPKSATPQAIPPQNIPAQSGSSKTAPTQTATPRMPPPKTVPPKAAPPKMAPLYTDPPKMTPPQTATPKIATPKTDPSETVPPEKAPPQTEQSETVPPEPLLFPTDPPKTDPPEAAQADCQEGSSDLQSPRIQQLGIPGGANLVRVECLPADIDEHHLTSVMYGFGPVVSCDILRDNDSQGCIGIAYIRFESSDACLSAVTALHNEESPFHDFRDEEIPKLLLYLMS